MLLSLKSLYPGSYSESFLALMGQASTSGVKEPVLPCKWGVAGDPLVQYNCCYSWQIAMQQPKVPMCPVTPLWRRQIHGEF